MKQLETEKLKRIFEVYKPSVPMTNQNGFVGRTKEINELKIAMLAPGRHAVVYGERGVGKTSLIKFVNNLVCDENKYTLIEYRCSSWDTFESIFRKLLSDLGKNEQTISSTNSYERTIDAKADIVIAEGGAKSIRKTEENINPVIPLEALPDYIASKLKNEAVILHIDEFDLIETPEVKTRISEVLKTLSDYSSKVKIIISGVSDIASDLFGGHQSTVRNISKIYVPRMKDHEIKKIIENGESALSLTFSNTLKKILINISKGLPYFTHLLCEELAIHALSHHKSKVDIMSLNKILLRASEKITGHVKSGYDAILVRHYTVLDSVIGIPVDTSPIVVRRGILHALAIIGDNDLDKLADLSSQLISNDGVLIPEGFKEIKADDVHIHLTNMLSIGKNFLHKVNGSFCFIDSYCEAYVLVQATAIHGHTYILESL